MLVKLFTSEQPPHCHFPLVLRMRTLSSQEHLSSSPRAHDFVTSNASAAADIAWTYAFSRLSAAKSGIERCLQKTATFFSIFTYEHRGLFQRHFELLE